MCGIIGLMAYGNMESPKQEKIRQEAMIFMVTKLLQLTQERGKDATGIATLFDNCDFMGLKMGIPAKEFVVRFGKEKTDFEGYLDVWRKKTNLARIVLGHCRKPSIGTTATADDNSNNHPIKIGTIVGVHNGTLTNDKNIFEHLGCGRDGKVDSEAIFRLLNHVTNGGQEPFSIDAIKETCKRLAGSYAVLSFNGNNPYQLAAFRDARPIDAVLVKPLKIVALASEQLFLKNMLFEYTQQAALFHTANFPLLRKGDVEISILPDDSMFLFDTRKEITPETRLDELFLKERIPRAVKMWNGKGNAATGNQTTWNNQNNLCGYGGDNHYSRHQSIGVTNPQVPAGTKANLPAKTQTATSGENTSRLGMAYDSKKACYIPVQEVDAVKKHGTMIVNCETGLIVGAAGDSLPVTLTEVKGPVDANSMVSGKGDAKINQIDSGMKETTTSAKPDNIKEVNMTTPDPKVIEKATLAAAELQRFSNNGELAEALEINDVSNMASMAMYSLVNRAMVIFFKYGYEAGYAAAREDSRGDHSLAGDSPNAITERMVGKIKSNRDQIRNLKTMVHILDKLSQFTVNDYKIRDSITEVLGTGAEANLEVIGRIFRPGDRQKMTVVDKVMDKIAERNKE